MSADDMNGLHTSFYEIQKCFFFAVYDLCSLLADATTFMIFSWFPMKIVHVLIWDTDINGWSWSNKSITGKDIDVYGKKCDVFFRPRPSSEQKWLWTGNNLIHFGKASQTLILKPRAGPNFREKFWQRASLDGRRVAPTFQNFFRFQEIRFNAAYVARLWGRRYLFE
jgi:hypothetical protein